MDRDSDLWKKYAHVTDEVLIDEPFQERDLSTVKSAWLLESWIDEKTLRQIESVHDVAPGDLHHRTDLMAGCSRPVRRCWPRTTSSMTTTHRRCTPCPASSMNRVTVFVTGAVPTCYGW